jgi:hypothetical protein
MDQEKITQTIRKMIADRNAGSAAEREKIYAAARSAIDRTSSRDPAAMMELEAAIGTIESSYMPEPERSASPGRPNSLRRHLAAVVIDVILGAAVAAVVVAVALPLLTSDGKAIDKLKYQYEETLPLVPVAVDALHKVSAMVIRMQKDDPVGLEDKASKGYVSWSVLDPELAKKMPTSVPPGSAIIVKADRKDYKILFNWTLCGAVSITKPEMVDPVRTKINTIGCPYFGLWTDGAAKW